MLEVAFNNQKGNPNYPAVDWSKSNLFENSRTRLYGGFIDSLTTCDGVKKIVVSNPSVNDFLRKEFTNKSSNQKENIANQAVCVDQLMRIYGPNFYDDDFIKHLSDNHFLEKAIVFNPHNYYKAVFYMACLRINDTDQFNTLLLDGINYFVSSTAMIIDYGSFNSLNNIITKMITNETLKYYSFLLQENNLKQVIKLIKYKCTYYEYMSLYNELTILDDSQREEILYFALEDAVNDAISEMDRNALIDNTDVEENTEYYDADGGDIYIDENALAALVDERAEEAFLYSIDNNDEICEIRKLYNYTDDEILECFRGLFSSSDVVEEFLYADKGYDDYDRYKEYEIDVSGSNNNQRIDEMFQGLLDGVDKK